MINRIMTSFTKAITGCGIVASLMLLFLPKFSGNLIVIPPYVLAIKILFWGLFLISFVLNRD
jgi:uncharacterized membrane protein HdeD (DUF308 family)